MLIGTTNSRVAILGGVRTPFARSHTAYTGTDNQELLTAALRALVERYRLQGQRLGDVIAGAVIKHPKDFNLTRESLLSTGLDSADARPRCAARLRHQPGGGHPGRQQDRAGPDRRRHRRRGRRPERSAGGVPAVLPAAAAATAAAAAASAQRIRPWLGLRPRDLKPVLPAVVEPRTGLSMGQSCELMVKTWNITREEQDQLAYESHVKAAAAWHEGFYDDLVVPFRDLKTDNNVRADASLDRARQAQAGVRSERRRQSDRRQQHAADRWRSGAAAGLGAAGRAEHQLPVLA